MSAAKRNFGLDLVRSIAIAFVLAAHCILFFFPYAFQKLRELFGIFGAFGVEIFFVLSGFLIGQLIVKEVLRPPSGRGLLHFWSRRWFRTIPPYVLALMLRRIVGYPLHWRYFAFLQYFDPHVLGGFPISWSLAVEEWFYLLTPLALLVAAGNRRGATPRRFFLVCGAIGAAALGCRIAYVLSTNALWDPAVRQHPFLRMDTLMVGVLLGGLRAYERPVYERLARSRRALGLAGAGGLAIAMAWLFVAIRNYTLNESFPMRTVFFDWLAVSVALLILAVESSPRVNEAWAAKWWAGPVRFVSLSSYSLYLIHLSAFEPLLALNARVRDPRLAWAWMLAALAISLALAGAMYRWFERPVLRLRDRWLAPVPIERPPA